MWKGDEGNQRDGELMRPAPTGRPPPRAERLTDHARGLDELGLAQRALRTLRTDTRSALAA